jgi:uncharacterized repeat protein (TIGR03803 family)
MATLIHNGLTNYFNQRSTGTACLSNRAPTPEPTGEHSALSIIAKAHTISGTKRPPLWKAGALLLISLLVAWNSPAQIYSVISALGGSAGQFPGLTPVGDGTTLYGMTRNYVFRVNQDGTDCTGLRWYYENDTGPSAGGLTLDGSTLYVAAWHYGLWATNYGHGAVFKINTDGSGFAVLKQFVGDPDGDHPSGAPMLKGTNLFCATDEGVVFRVDTNGTDFRVLKRLDGSAGGNLLLANGRIYGTTSSGGAKRLGSVYRMNLDGTEFQVLHEFTGGAGGSYPESGLALGGDTLYGLTLSGGSSGRGTVFKLETDGGGFRVIHEFADGSSPQGNLALWGRMLYGGTQGGGAFNQGTLFQINTNGDDFATIRSFDGSDGAAPRSGLIRIGDILYGTTYFGGSLNSGVVFSLRVLPTILSAPKTQTAEAGSSAQFRVSATPTPLNYFWFQNETNLLSSGTNSSLTLSNVQFAAAGSYTVLISNLLGTVTSTPAMLNIIVPVEKRMAPAIRLTGAAGTIVNLDYYDAFALTPSWTQLTTITLESSPKYCFDASKPLPPHRFYRAWQTPPTTEVPVLGLEMVTALTLTGAVGSQVRVETINQVGPTDGWFPLSTVTLTNSTQLYFDVSMLGQPARLYRLVPVP